MKNSNDTIGNRTRDLPVCSVVPQTTSPCTSTSEIPFVGSGQQASSNILKLPRIVVNMFTVCVHSVFMSSSVQHVRVRRNTGGVHRVRYSSLLVSFQFQRFYHFLSVNGVRLTVLGIA